MGDKIELIVMEFLDERIDFTCVPPGKKTGTVNQP